MSAVIKLTLVLITIPFFLLSYYNHPSADDFCSANKILELGFWDAQADWYFNWSGRYFGMAANSLYSTLILALGKDNFIANFFGFYKFVSLFLFSLFFLSLFCFFKAIAGKITDNWNIFWLTFLGFAIYLSQVPSTAEGFYWLNGAFNYTLGNIAFLFLLSLSISSSKLVDSENFYKKFFYILISCLLAAAVVGSSEIFAIILLITACLGLLLTLHIRHNSSFLYKIILGVTVICIAVSFLSPGTFRRHDLALEAEKVNLSFSSIVGFILYFIKNLNSWIINPTLFSTSLLFIPIAIVIAKKLNFYKYFQTKTKPIVLYVVSWLSLVTITFFLPFLSAGYLPGRVLNISYFFFLIGWFIGIVVLVDFLGHQFLDTLIVPKYIIIFAQTILVISFIFNSNFGQASYDLLVSAPRYHTQLQNRYSLIQKSLIQNQKTIIVPALKKPLPKTIHFSNDIKNNPRYWANGCYARFFKLDAIATTNKR